MTKDKYFELCEMMGNEPLDEEIPVEFEDLITEVQLAFLVYRKLRDEWDPMSGSYLGKSMSGILDIFKILDIEKEDTRPLFDIINIIDEHRIEEVANKLKQRRAAS